ncbi:MAG: diguanylate cyclase [Pirellulaceae bacterium]
MNNHQVKSSTDNPYVTGLTDVCFRKIVENASDAVIVSDADGHLQFFNRAAEELLGTSALERSGQAYRELIGSNCEANLEAVASELIEVQLVTKLHGLRWCEIQRTQLRFQGQSWCCDFIRDCHERKIRELSWMEEARTDSLTGIANRGEFQRQLELNLAAGLALAILDLDRFKHINDSHGHVQGDDVLQFVSSCLESELKASVCIGRLGGDEFGFLLSGVGPEELAQVCERVRRCICEGEGFADQSVSVSIGGVCCTNAKSTARELLTAADRLLYEAKALGRNAVRTEAI